MPARAREKKDEAVRRVQEQVGRAREVVTTTPALQDPKVLAGITAALVALLVVLRRRRA